MQYYTAFAEDPVVVVSDLHCSSASCRVGEVVALASRSGAKTLVVLGDLFDDLHRPLSTSELRRILASLFRGAGELEVVYVASLSSHDPLLQGAARFRVNAQAFRVYPGPVVARLGRLTALLTHGDLALRNGAHAFLLNSLMGAAGAKLFLERKLRKALRLPQHWWLFMGHTHVPGIDYDARVANAGSWRDHWLRGLPYWRPPSHTYLLVESGRVELGSAKRFLKLDSRAGGRD